MAFLYNFWPISYDAYLEFYLDFLKKDANFLKSDANLWIAAKMQTFPCNDF